MKHPPPHQEREYADWLLRIEERAILPLKWIVLSVSALMWLWTAHWMIPPIHVFTLFFVYMLLTLALTFFLRRRRVTPSQVRPFVLCSYGMDLIFVSLVFVFDVLAHRAGGLRQSEFYLLYFLVILRGFAILRSTREHLAMSILVSLLFVATLWLQERSFRFVGDPSFLVKFALIWLVILMSWFIVEIIDSQQREVMRTREQLLRSENLARLGEVAAGIAHEINNPMGIVSAYSEFLMKQSRPDDPLLDDYRTIHEQALRCKTIVSEMMALAAPGTIVFSSVDLPSLLREVRAAVTEDLGDAAGRRFRIEEDYGADLAPVRGQPDQLRQAFLNVMTNACQALSEDGGMVRLSARRLADRASAPVQVLIEDSGAGISPEDAEKAFEPFYTRRRGGTGLGLAITRRIVEAHGGSIAIRAGREGRGATVEIVLPVEEESS